MTTPKSLGRAVGALLLVQALLAIPVYTEAGMMRSIIAPGFLPNAAPLALQVRIADLLTYVLGALTLAVALLTFPLFRQLSERLAVLYLGLSFAGLAMQLVESVATRNLVAMSVLHARPDAPVALLEGFAPLARSVWGTAHFTNLVMGHTKMLVLYTVLLRFALVPRPVPALGVVASLLAISAALLSLLGRPFSYLMVAPAGLVSLALTAVLLVRGFVLRPTISEVA